VIRRALLVAAAFLASGCITRLVESPSPTSSPSVSRSTSPIAASAVARSDDPSGSPVATDVESPPATEEARPSAGGPEIVVSVRSAFGTLRVHIRSNGLVEAARPATQAELERIDVASLDIGVRNLGGSDLLVDWAGSFCDRDATLVVDPTQVFVGPAPRPGCDALGFGWGVVLTTRSRIDASQMTTRLGPTVLSP
jgi:hypothetical protein